jgi:hypothetical protein
LLADPEVVQDPKHRRYFFKISNAYYMTVFKYYHQDHTLTRHIEHTSKDDFAP